ncbi:MAG: ATP-binding protein [Bacteroidia bacterium]|nr:ATP-binding protein [Bacteroidia bacterium]
MNRNNLLKHIELWKSKLGSYSAVAKKCDINGGALSTILEGKYGANEEHMLQRIAKALDYRETNWKLVKTISNYRIIHNVFSDAKNEAMWFPISNKAGSGKTGTLEDIFNNDTSGTVVFIQSEEWSGRTFLMKLIEKTVGEKVLKTGGYKSVSALVDIVVNYFNDMSLERPVLLIDEADKLKPAALRTLIPLYNRTEGRLGLIISGTENFEKEMKAGVRLAKKGYDELDSRFGRNYIHLPGANQKEVYAICEANGIKNNETQMRIWGELEKVSKPATVKTASGVKTQMVDYAEDFRRINRLIKRELLISKQAV